ncbi:MAG: LysM domain-containing protein, partial [Candidatus Aerophobetes bacterium]|nr:LysM domain-containing protein [Candidatus Aerophobetes bacterium]
MVFKAGYRRKIWLVFIPVLLSYFVLLIFSLSCLGSYKYHTVRKGETLYRISRFYGVTVDEIRRTNHLGSNTEIYPGQKLLITLSEKDGVYHRVKESQTLWSIARTY